MKNLFRKYERVISVATIVLVICGWVVDKAVFQKMHKIEITAIKKNQTDMMIDMRNILELRSQATLLIELLKPKVTEDGTE